MNNSDDGNYVDAGKDDDVMSGVEQPMEEVEIDDHQQDDNGFSSQTTRQSSSSMQKKRVAANIAINSPKKAQIPQTFGTEEDLDLVADMDELDLLSDTVMQFEQTAFETKKRVNALDRLTYKSQLLPPTLRLCYQALFKSWMQDTKGKATAKTDFDSENLEFLLSESIKSSGNCIKEFSKFKGQFYALNEPIINKDICNLSYEFVCAQVKKQLEQVEKLSLIEDQVSINDGQIEELKNKFEMFQSEKFDEKQRLIESEGQEVKELVAELDEKDEKSSGIFKDAKKLLKESRPQTKDQRTRHSDINSKLQKAERKYQKWKTNFDAHSLKQAELHDQIDKCQKIVENLEELQIRTMVGQSKKMQKLIDSSLAISKYKLKLQGMTEDLDSTLREAMQLQESCIEFQRTLLDDLLAEYQDLVDKIRKHSQNLEDDVLKISDSLSNFEEKVGEMKISDQDHFFLNKEILRFRTAINAIDSQRGIYMEDTEAIEDKFSIATNSLDSENVSPISQDDLQKLRDNLKHLQKQDEVELPKTKKGVDGLEQYVMRSLKNQLNGDNKLSQTNISKVKKNYDEFLKMFEKLNNTYNDCVQKVNNFNSKFDSDDLERRDQLNELQERLKEEEVSITGVKKVEPKVKKETDEGEGEGEVENQEASVTETADVAEDQGQTSKAQPESLQKTKRQIIEAINGLVNQFNDITKILRDSSGKTLKAEGPLNDLIAKNKQIQANCDETHEIIDNAKKETQDIQSRLQEIINAQMLDELMKKYRSKENIIDDCNKVRSKAEKQQTKLAQQLAKHIETVEDQVKKLDMFNPINGSGASSQNQEFLDEISEKIDSTKELLETLQKLREDNGQIMENITSACLPLTEVDERVVTVQELEQILETLNAVNSDLSAAESDIGPKQADITKMQKDVKALIGQEVEGRLKEGQSTLDVVDQDLTGCHEIHTSARKRLKSLRDLVDRAQKQQGKTDPQLLEQLDEMKLEADQLEDMIGELDTKLNDQKRKKTEAKKQMEDMVKGMQGLQKFKPNQMEVVLTSLDELKDKNGWITEKLQNIESKMNTKLKDVEEIVASCEKKQEMTKLMSEAETEMEEDLTNLKDLLERLPKLVKQLKGTIAEMSASAGPADDFSEKKDELTEQLEELEEIEVVVDKFDETFNALKDERDKLKKQKGKSTADIQQLQKLLDQFQENKDALSGLFTDALDTQEQLQDLRKDVGDCDIPMLITKRKQEMTQFTTKGERLKKELLNLKKAKKKNESGAQAAEDKVGQMLKELEFKLKIFDKDKTDLTKSYQRELDTIQPADFDDLTKASEQLKKVRKFKNAINEAEGKLKDLEEVQTDIVKKMTEQDLENSTDLLSLKAQELRDRLKESREQLQKIQKSGDAMDGNTSTNEEEEFIQAIKNEMPEVLDNIETNLGLLVEIEKLVPDVKQSMSLEKMNDLREKVEIATENVEESEGLVIKLEKEILEWNAQKKLCKRDIELEEAKNLLNDYIDDLCQEKQNTEIELHRNREKQEENRDQEMVDKDGKKVDIMKDLVRLEEEMENYLKEIGVLLEEVQERETQREKLIEDFNKAIPQVIIEERQRRTEHIKSLKPPERQLKRPPMMLKKQKTIKPDGKTDDHCHENWCPHHMLQTNCKYRNPIKNLLKDLKGFNQRRKDLEDKYANMRREVFKIKQIKLYKPVQGDAVDEMFAGYLNKAKLTIEVQRISASNYMFGTKKILAKIINGRLVIRVGGGYMNAEEFIEQYGKIEMMKIMKQGEKEGGFDTLDSSDKPATRSTMPVQSDPNNRTMGGRRVSGAPASNMMNQIGDAMKEKMRQQLLNVKAYDSQNTVSMREKKAMRQTMAMDNNSSLGNSLRQTKALNVSSSKAKQAAMTAEDKARNKEAIGNMASALNSIKNNRSAANFEGVNSARKLNTHLNMESIGSSQLSGRGGSKSPATSQPHSAAATPNSGNKSKISGIQRRSTIFHPGVGKK